MKQLHKRRLREIDELEQTVFQVHPFLVRAHYAFHTLHKVFVIFDYIPGGDLTDLDKPLSASRAQFYAAEIVLVLGYLHSQGLVYHNLVPENILIDKDGHIQLTHFFKTDIDLPSPGRCICFPSEYGAPEVRNDEPPYTNGADWWILGTMLYEMLCGLPPFWDENSRKMWQMILTGDVTYPDTLSDAARDIIGKLLQKDPADRLGAGEGDAMEIMAHPFWSGIDWDALLEKEIEPEWKPASA
jgi:serine/threonine protein kinase